MSKDESKPDRKKDDSKARGINKSMFDTSSLSKALESNRAMFDSSVISKALEINKSMFDTSSLSKALESNRAIFDSSVISKALEINKSMFDTSSLSKALESNRAMFDSSVISKTLGINKSMFDTSSLSKALESNRAMFDSSVISKALEINKNMFDTSSLSKALKGNRAMFDSSVISKALEINKSMFDTSSLSKALESNRALFDTSALSKSFKLAQDLVDTSVLSKAFESTSKLFNNKHFNETIFDSTLLSQITNTATSFTKHFAEFKNLNISNLLQDINVSGAELSLVGAEGNNIKIDGGQYNLIEIREMIKDVLIESGISSIDVKLNESFNKLFNKIAELSDTKIKSIVFNIITQLLLGIMLIITTPKINELAEKYIFQNPKPIVKKIEKIVKQTPVDIKSNLINYRFITVNILNVRAHPNQKSMVIGKLYLGYLVEFIEKKKSWMLVEYRNSELNLVLRGWVFSRYAKQFK